ncbi:MAG: CRISPR-associated endonuclease Cas4/Cas1, partial [Myxococcota bacterium]
MADAAQDELLAVRAVNAHTFCPRLFWLKERAGLFHHNEHTLEGEAAHKRVSQPGGSLRAPVDGDEPWHARSLWLSSNTLGI